ncbi:MAG: polynucleotide adenylyltransferase, partial [Clostridiales bacterium]|nr:polynucleotide adenylyltransferase [Clostridiales bacterium]
MPEAAEQIIERLNCAGYEAYVVGGCVRDILIGRTPKDWDICTSASPVECERVFEGMPSCRIVETGLQHGTVTLVMDHVPYEVTTYRADGSYSDHRHPDSVRFVHALREDLARRDFTVNAMAYHPKEGVQ